MKKILKYLIAIYIVLGLGVCLVFVGLNKNDETLVADNESTEQTTDEETDTTESTDAEDTSIEESSEAEEATVSEESTEESEEESVDESVEESTEEEDTSSEEQTYSTDPVDMVVDAENPHYYRFEILGGTNNVRAGSGVQNTIIYTITTGDTGYVIEPGTRWSKIATKKGVGYCANRFLTTYEISKDDIPSEYFDE